MRDIELQIMGYRLTTAEIIYRMPDYPAVLQSFIWQCLDQAPRFPRLNRFLTYWEGNLDGPIHSVHVASAALIKPAELRMIDGQFQLQ